LAQIRSRRICDSGRPARHPAGRFAVQNRSRRFCEHYFHFHLIQPANKKKPLNLLRERLLIFKSGQNRVAILVFLDALE
jgi:hypothetical protein